MQAARTAKPLPFKVDPGNISLRTRKAELRSLHLQRRRTIPLDLHDTTNWKAANHLRTLLGGLTPTVVALYYPRRGEVDLRPLAEDLRRQGFTVCLPRVTVPGHPLAFNIWEEGHTEYDAMSLPTGTGQEMTPQVIITPMLGYNRKGYRLGYGGGFYDATLKASRLPILTIGVCHTELEIPDFPAEYHDQRLDYIVTGKEVIHCI